MLLYHDYIKKKKIVLEMQLDLICRYIKIQKTIYCFWENTPVFTLLKIN